MTRLTRIAAVALAALVASAAIVSTASAFTIPPSLVNLLHKNQSHPTNAVECSLHGDSLIIFNWGNDNLDSGRQIAWASPTTGDGGVLLLPKMLAPGEQVKIADALSTMVGPGTRCEVAVV
jgi:hypothetical protein